MFTYRGNNPINTIDPSGHCFMFITAAIGAVAGAVIGGIVAASNGGDWKKGALIGAAVGGLVGLGAGAAAGVVLAGRATASTAAVMTGGSALAATIGGGGLIAGGKMIADNISQAATKAPTVFWSGGTKTSAAKVAQSVGGKTLEMTRLGQHLENTNAPIEMWKAASLNFANVANNTGASLYSIQNAAGIRIQSIWATVEYPLLSSRSIIYGVVSQNGTITIIP